MLVSFFWLESCKFSKCLFWGFIIFRTVFNLLESFLYTFIILKNCLVYNTHRIQLSIFTSCSIDMPFLLQISCGQSFERLNEVVVTVVFNSSTIWWVATMTKFIDNIDYFFATCQVFQRNTQSYVLFRPDKTITDIINEIIC